VKYESKEWGAVPELLRTEWALSLGGLRLRAGRVPWQDPLGYIAGGLFDGVEASVDAGAGEFHAAAFYTGFLYKKTARITMTDEEAAAAALPLDYGDFAGTYLAPRRLLAAAGFEHPGIAETLRLKTALIAQYDLRPEELRLHTGYLAARAALPLGSSLTASAGAAAELILTDRDGRLTQALAFAGDLGLDWALPTAIPDRLSLLGRYSSGGGSTGSPVVGAFTPVTTEPQGRVLRAKLSSLSMIQAAWRARLRRDLSLSAEAAWFIRGDPAAWKGRPSGPSGRLLGAEFFAETHWSPVPDLQLRLGGGAFLPALGNTAPSDPPFWRVELGLLLAAY
ncbi:MAG: hypothetical protein LBD09_06740, partial [Treponema sp.]|nr:hypothetical protein [Treponema sp.]